MFIKPNVFISSCLELRKCRYDGGIITSDEVRMLLPHINVYTECPEMAIGLSSPRDAIRLIQRKEEEIKMVSSTLGVDITDKMSLYLEGLISDLLGKELDGFILKAKSPSCGVGDVKIYKDFGKAMTLSSKGVGLFGEAVLNNFPNTPLETERRLSNYSIRDRFLIQIFSLAEFREVRKKLKLKDLVDYHARHKYLFMTYNQVTMTKLGRIVANQDKHDTKTVFQEYDQILRELLAKEPTQKRRLNVLTHIYGYFKEKISASEKEFYFDTLDEYMNNQRNYMNVLLVLKSWAIRFNDSYLLQQTIFEPYPKDLVIMLDSGKRV